MKYTNQSLHFAAFKQIFIHTTLFIFGAYVFGQDANSGNITKIGKTQASSACGGLPSHLTKPLTYVF